MLRDCQGAAQNERAGARTRSFSALGWGSSFVAIATLVLVSLIVFRIIRPRELAGDKGEKD
jgi:hypothetical protein